ncbi:CinA family protein [Rubellimicrobium aerolatum]|uniref:CinA family protein n=1 Tax=Rubellimicrobium aerolatum TaxID=490979 RepID=A0ABW0SAD9_9RHOB|nr:CinA family protein [Rubellimicrobium aerolatum]MBP1805264.1 nicotinamide-nucleotide amidase [Rubellimicrobium aerolatum]
MTETLSSDIPIDIEAAVARSLRRACDAELTLATAESCTGGLLASLLTDVEGCSHAFERGFVVYTEAAKTELLGVPPEMLEAHTAVSEPVARAMAEGALAQSRADIVLAVTGYAGPTEEGEEGLVHFACARRGRATIHCEAHYGAVGRGAVRIECLRTALEMIEERLD